MVNSRDSLEMEEDVWCGTPAVRKSTHNTAALFEEPNKRFKVVPCRTL